MKALLLVPRLPGTGYTGDRLRAEVHLAAGGDAGEKTRMCARVSPRTRVAIGKPAELSVDTSRLYFFDPETRAAI